MLVLIVMLLFIVCTLIIFILEGFIFNSRLELLNRLSEIQISKDDMSEMNLPFKTRVIKPMLDSVEKLWSRLTPEGVKKSIIQQLNMAGKEQKNGVGHFLTLKLASAIIFPSVIFFTLRTIKTGSALLFLMTVVSSLAGFYYPSAQLKTRIRQRQLEIQKTLPDVVDLVTVSVEAGLTFDAAISKVGEKMPGHLAAILQRALQEIKMGKPRKESFKEMAAETGVEEFISFINAIVQADQLGVSIANILRVQSVQMREKRRQQIQEKAMKAPVKMLVPMVLFIFPTIFIILLGPAILTIVEIFAK